MTLIIICQPFSEPDSKELQEAISKTTFQHDLANLDPATTYSIYLKAYSALGASPVSSTVVATTLGGGMEPHTFLLQHYSKSIKSKPMSIHFKQSTLNEAHISVPGFVLLNLLLPNGI